MSDPLRDERRERAEAEVAALRTELARVSEKLIQALARERAALAASVAPPEYEYVPVTWYRTSGTSVWTLSVEPETPVFRRVAPQEDTP